jgi:antitoxin component YwqK of YwqJK toxin-antitoxin module
LREEPACVAVEGADMRTTTLLMIVGAVGACALALPLFAGGQHRGLQTSEYADGTPRERVAWIDGEREGPCVRWHRDGSLRAEGTFEAGKMVGEWTFYAADGSRDAARSGAYVNGRRDR